MSFDLSIFVRRVALMAAAAALALSSGCGGPTPEFRVSGQVAVNRCGVGLVDSVVHAFQTAASAPRRLPENLHVRRQ